MRSITESDHKIGDYEVIEMIGKGSFGVVYKSRHIPTNTIVALKAITKDNLQNEEITQNFLKEVEISRNLHHPFIAELFDFFETSSKFFMVVEYAENGSLKSYLNNAKLNEKEARRIFIQLLSALEYLQNDKHIAHRDLKVENILLDRHNNVKLIDFGLSRFFQPENPLLKTRCGSPLYAAPEIIRGEYYNAKCDIWSAGIILYLMIAGEFPFYGRNIQHLFNEILKSNPEYPDFFSEDLKHFLKQIFQNDTKERVSFPFIKHHKWLYDLKIKSDLTSSLKLFSNCQKIDSEIKKSMISLGIDCKQLEQNLNEGKFEMETTSYLLLRKEKLKDKVNELLSNDQLNSTSSPFNSMRRSSNPFIKELNSIQKNYSNPKNRNVILRRNSCPDK
jgi:serine/threonine protein kinase